MIIKIIASCRKEVTKTGGSTVIVASNLPHGHMISYVKRVSQCTAESRGFSPGILVSSHKEVDRVGLQLAPNWD